MNRAFHIGIVVAVLGGWVSDFIHYIDTTGAMVLGFIIIMALYFGGLYIAESLKEK